MSNTSIHSNTSGGIGICGATFIVFLVLKLTGHIAWSWWWVTAPLWIPVVIVLGVLLIAVVVAIVVSR
jgi:hypothetical protein